MNKYKEILTKEFLIQEYFEKEKSSNIIAKKLDCNGATIRNYLKKFRIPRRNISEATKIYLKRNPRKLEQTSNYKDGRTLKQYYCKDCNKELSYQTGFYEGGRCSSCAAKLRWKSKEYRENQRKISKRRWQNEKYREKNIKASFEGRKISPNKPEKLLNNLLQEILPNKYKYNKTVIIAGLVPDFVNKKEKKIIELYGNYWHNRPEVKKRDKNRLGIYELFGNYKGLIIWEHELKDLEKLKKKILKFSKKRRR